MAFIDQEVRALGLLVTPTKGAPIAVVPQPALAGAVVPVPTPYDRLRRFINRNRRRGFIDLRSPGLTRLRFIVLKLRAMRSQAVRAPVYVGEHNGQKEYWFPSDRFEEVAGGADEALALKKDIDRRGLLVTTRRGRRVSYVVKRPLPDGSRPFFVVIRHRPQQSPGRRTAHPTVATV